MKTVKFMQDGNNTRIISFNDETISDNLNPGVYSLRLCQFTGFYLRNHSPRFDVPETVYGSTKKKVQKIINSYLERDDSTGVLLSGDKGSGKTMTSSMAANRMIDMGYPVILIEESFSGSSFNEFLNNIGECCLFFDEFGKMYRKHNESESEGESQSGLLSLFDGAGSQKRLIILTENNQYDINEFMLDRPGRVYYHFRHKKLEPEMITEYCKANEVPEATIEEIILRCETSWSFSFDVLQAIVEEWTRYGGSIEQIAADLNIEQPITRNEKLEVKSVIDTQTQESYDPMDHYKVIDYPATGHESVRWVVSTDEDGERSSKSTHISVKDIVSRKGNTVVFECLERNVLITTELMPIRAYNYNPLAV